MILIDTNILIHLSRDTDPKYATVNAVENQLVASGKVICIVPQSIYEFWASATRPPTARGLGITPEECWERIQKFLTVYTFLPDQANLYDEWQRLVVTYQCHGRVSFDARLVAAMNTHQITQILTYNGPDFARFPSIQILDPPSLLLSP